MKRQAVTRRAAEIHNMSSLQYDIMCELRGAGRRTDAPSGAHESCGVCESLLAFPARSYTCNQAAQARQRRVIGPNLEHVFIPPFVWMASGRLIGKLQTRGLAGNTTRFEFGFCDRGILVEPNSANTSPHATRGHEPSLLTVTRPSAAGFSTRTPQRLIFDSARARNRS